MHWCHGVYFNNQNLGLAIYTGHTLYVICHATYT